MTTTPLQSPPLPATRPCRTAPENREHVLHLFDRSSLEFAKVHGLQIKALCGRWITPSRPGGIIYGEQLGRNDRVCGNCRRSAARRPRSG